MPRGQKKTRAVFFCAAGCCGNGNAGVWTRRPKVSVIQRAKPVESPIQGQSSTSSFPRWNQRWDSRAERENDCNVLEYVVVIMVQPTGGLRRRKVRGASLPPCGESFARSLAPPFRPRSASLGSRPRRGLSLTLPLNDVRELRCAAGCCRGHALPLKNSNAPYLFVIFAVISRITSANSGVAMPLSIFFMECITVE